MGGVSPQMTKSPARLRYEVWRPAKAARAHNRTHDSNPEMQSTAAPPLTALKRGTAAVRPQTKTNGDRCNARRYPVPERDVPEQPQQLRPELAGYHARGGARL